MNKELYEKVRAKEALVILTDTSAAILWESSRSPVSALYKAYFGNSLPTAREFILYANQAGIAMGLLAGKLPIRECHAVRMSVPGREAFRACQVCADCEELISLVSSSKDETLVCPIEEYLSLHDDISGQWAFLEQRFKVPDIHRKKGM